MDSGQSAEGFSRANSFDEVAVSSLDLIPRVNNKNSESSLVVTDQGK